MIHDENEAALMHLATLRVQTQLKDPTFEREGKRYISMDADVWHDILVHTTPEGCLHLDSMCPGCVDSWLTDHYVRLVAADGSVVTVNHAPGMVDVSQLEEGSS